MKTATGGCERRTPANQRRRHPRHSRHCFPALWKQGPARLWPCALGPLGGLPLGCGVMGSGSAPKIRRSQMGKGHPGPLSASSSCLFPLYDFLISQRSKFAAHKRRSSCSGAKTPPSQLDCVSDSAEIFRGFFKVVEGERQTNMGQTWARLGPVPFQAKMHSRM
ncbi:hypothetical protein B0T25DRAFT_301726 [Lasiosphaeria hispida]|uniref:Uncharacterized protein n=1 Tax=Lasiosphaeria hispida TaxID=260671 RepID=A0AAJ0H897_9PEZI|nr:hypothetical protein B0T25DRAFT_301726 [Lasiosphaeria hispida]